MAVPNQGTLIADTALGGNMLVLILAFTLVSLQCVLHALSLHVFVFLSVLCVAHNFSRYFHWHSSKRSTEGAAVVR